MKNKTVLGIFLLILTPLLLSGCEIITTIFKGGVWTGVLLMIAIIALIVFVIFKMTGGAGNK